VLSKKPLINRGYGDGDSVKMDSSGNTEEPLLCIEEKTRKIAPYRERYPECVVSSFLVVVSFSGGCS
jgi:hypothetical protein